MVVDAILWDYDGTLVNSVPKNIVITKQILSVIAPHLTGLNLPKCLQSEANYHIANHQSKNWQDLYVNFYGLTELEMLKAGSLWGPYQLKNTTPVKLFTEIKETVNQIHLPQGICSQNSSENITQVLEKYHLSHKFKSIIGYNDIPSSMQKPASFSGIKCLQQIFGTVKNKTIICIGDHESDVEFARNIGKELSFKNKVISIVATYSGADINSWAYQPDFELKTPLDLLKIVKNYR